MLIVTVGSRGDVAPYTGLAARLRAAGHAVTIATHRPFETLVTGTGCAFHALPGDPQTLLNAAALSVRAVPEIVRYLDRLAAALADAARPGVDVLVAGSATAPLVGRLGARLGVPVLGAYLQPAHPTRAFPPPITAARTFGGLGNRVAAHVVRTVLDGFSAPAARAHLGGSHRPPDAVYYGFSPAVLPPPPDWHPDLRVVGYWWPEPPVDWRPPASLVEFLAAGDPPVYVGLGSLGDGPRARRFAALAVQELRRHGFRVVAQGPAPADEGVLPLGDVPHARLFPHVAAVVHHGGAGTTAAALRAGVPVVPVPIQADQHLWARRSVQLGVAPGALRLRSATANRLVDAVRAAIGDPQYRANTARLAAVLAAEDGAGAVLEGIDRLAR
ncbi:UDP:flavonoid glycosyltransferase YjiC, YdhE family [Cryptosporangium aurantiacum]|uniref:UDP:flavonoid glycosyltransferase YjiC, YdhE family n=1 Tax=Cryptosporangium aurantiacum TaxID=134849 RepID=A0A1M7R6I9_9ACTN|nr:UDP:flavonoid glycosyltransferase YjiC, YdhE family [Cryptosporangium aurantiacum]